MVSISMMVLLKSGPVKEIISKSGEFPLTLWVVGHLNILATELLRQLPSTNTDQVVNTDTSHNTLAVWSPAIMEIS